MSGEFSEKSNSICSFIESFNKHLLGASGVPGAVKALGDLTVSPLAKVPFPWGTPVLTSYLEEERKAQNKHKQRL